MVMYYAVEFPSEDGKSKGLHIVPENKVKVENCQTQVLWTVVNENGEVMEEYFEAMNLKKGSRRDCGELIDHLKALKTEGLRGPGEPEFATLEKAKKDSLR